MNVRCPRIPAWFVLLVGVALGWVSSGLRPATLRAGAAERADDRADDRASESIVATGPVLVRYDEAAKAPIPLEAVYILDYKGARLLATVPTYRQTARSTEILEKFVERDLVVDFKLELGVGPSPHFLMTTGSLGPYTAGWAPLYVFETESKQVGVYRIHLQQSSLKSSRPRFELVELVSYAKASAPADTVR
jgi:hypothetical protein